MYITLRLVYHVFCSEWSVGDSFGCSRGSYQRAPSSAGIQYSAAAQSPSGAPFPAHLPSSPGKTPPTSDTNTFTFSERTLPSWPLSFDFFYSDRRIKMSILPLFHREHACPLLKSFRKYLVHPLTWTCCVCSTTSSWLCIRQLTPMCATHRPVFTSFYILVRDLTTAVDGWLCEWLKI